MTDTPKRLAAACATMLLAGCTTSLVVNKLEPETPNPTTGPAYSLPFLQYEVAITRTLKSCTKAGEVAGIEVGIAATAKPTYPRDPAHTYAIDYPELSSWTKTSSVALSFHENGMLKTVGAKANDMTGPIVVNAITGVAKLVAGVATGGAIFKIAPQSGWMAQGTAPEIPPEQPERKEFCGEKTIRALEQANSAKSTLDKATVALEDATARFKAFSDAAPLISKARGEHAHAMIDAAKTLATAQLAVTRASADLVKSLKKVTDVHVFKWPATSADVESEKTATNLMADWGINTNVPVSLSLHDLSGLGVRAPDGAQPAAKDDGEGGKHILFRQPVQAELRLSGCSLFTPAGRCLDSGRGDITVSTDPAPQLARVHALPLRNGPFQNNALSAEFTSDGRLLTFAYDDLAARGMAATDMLAKGADAARAGILDIRGAGTAAALADMKAQTELLQAQASHDQAVKALQSPTEAAILATDTELKKAEIANIEATMALRDARTALAAKGSN